MKKIILLFLLISSYTFSGTGWFNDFVYFTINGVTGSTYYIGGNPGSGTQLDGSTLGGAINELKITSTDMMYWSDTQDRTGGAFYYQIRASDNSTIIVAATEVIWTHSYVSGNNYQGTWSGTINLITGLAASTTYKLHIWAKSWGSSQGDSWLTNGGANYVGTFTTDGTVPVELSSFSALIKNKSVNLVWHTATEVNNFGFEIQRSIRNEELGIRNWSKVGIVKGNGNSNSPKEYSFADNSVTSGKYIYRLKQIDNDGKYEYSKEVEVDLGKPTTFALNQNYPNPFNPSTSIQYSVVGSQYVSLKVFNVLGKEVAVLVNEKQEPGTYTVDFTSANLSGGAYFYRLQAGDFVQTKKMILLK